MTDGAIARGAVVRKVEVDDARWVAQLRLPSLTVTLSRMEY